MELRHLRYFAALSETLNFTRAADKCHVTQSTLSHQIKQLEDELNTPLFERIGKRVVMTEAGGALLNGILPALARIDSTLNALQTAPDVLQGHLRIGATHSFNTRLVPQCIATFLERYPALKITVEELSQQRIVESLMSDTLDLGVAYRPLEEHELWFEPLYNEELVLVIAKHHPLAARKRLRMVELHNLRMTLLPPMFSTRQLLDEYFRAAGAEPQVVVELNSIAPMIELIRRTDLAGIVGATAVAESDGLRIVPLENPTPIRTPGLLWRRGGSGATGGREFAQVVRKLLNQPESHIS
ncbi:LysR substrate-binding domain-containing protein [Solimonas marina]|uniref:LysR family transcriptional regulator n=1 Tax=Solimonas marina TaxID=2714601 RepID=A0A970B8G4_9GAMM|nr:LysR substrate-binding domain-containing protein [Solimonas marina]NKF22254.1 LysR family transcriptional regulator [Solimonas marina]